MRMRITASILASLAISGASAQDASGGITTGKLGNASAVTNNPSGAQYIATLPDSAFDKAAFPNGDNVKGSIQAVSMPNGKGVVFHVEFSNLPQSGGPFLYHLHDQPVPANGNCTGTLAHLDPFQRGEQPPCDPAHPETCQVGDLSGKHGTISSPGTFSATYTDDFASALNGIGAFFGNRSFVLHFANTTRITCANFTSVAAESAGSCSGTTSSSTATKSEAATPTQSTTATQSTGTRTTTATTTSSRPTGTKSTASASTTFATAAGNVHSPAMTLAAGAAALAFLL